MYVATICKFSVGCLNQLSNSLDSCACLDTISGSESKSPAEIASFIRAQREIEYPGGMLITNPIPEEYAMPADQINAAIDQALREADEQHVKGKAITPFLLARVCELTGGESLASNIQLVLNNVRLASQIAVELAK